MDAYLDNAATSWPKPESVYRAVSRFMRLVGATPGRSGHRREEEAARICDSIAEAVIATSRMMPPYIREHPEFGETGNRMLAIWQEGVDAFAKTASRGDLT